MGAWSETERFLFPHMCVPPDHAVRAGVDHARDLHENRLDPVSAQLVESGRGLLVVQVRDGHVHVRLAGRDSEVG